MGDFDSIEILYEQALGLGYRLERAMRLAVHDAQPKRAAKAAHAAARSTLREYRRAKRRNDAYDARAEAIAEASAEQMSGY
jgi:hypothetical protein